MQDKHYIHLVTLLGDLQTRMLKTFEVIASQVADHGLRLDEAVKETSSMRKLIEENNTILKGVDTRLKEVERVQTEWKAASDEEFRKADAEEDDDDED